MKVRIATVTDAEAIDALIRSYAEQDKMLFRSMADIYENLQSFLIAETAGKVVGCCALQIIWADLAEIKSLAVNAESTGAGAGKSLILAATQRAARLGISRVFALTLEPGFFEKLAFEVIDRNKLPMKVWSDCARCPKQQNCDEIAVIKQMNKSPAS